MTYPKPSKKDILDPKLNAHFLRDAGAAASAAYEALKAARDRDAEMGITRSEQQARFLAAQAQR